jgi:type II secretory pathway predicted ATPase ExeA
MDFLEFYSLKEHPFSNVVDSRFYYNCLQHENALVKLRHSVDTKRGLAVVVGDIGSGKTTLARRLLEDLDENKYEAALLVIMHSSVSSEWLLKKLALQLGLSEAKDEKIELLSQIGSRLHEIQEQGRIAVVLMDEVQMLNSKEIMEEFRGLLNMEMPEGKMINFIFFGLNELEDVLSLDEPLKQRVAMKIKLSSFKKEDAHNYILHRLKVAGSTKTIFTESAIESIFKFSSGLPRLINTICDNALLEGFLIKSETIDENIIKTAVTDLGLSEEDKAPSEEDKAPSEEDKAPSEEDKAPSEEDKAPSEEDKALSEEAEETFLDKSFLEKELSAETEETKEDDSNPIGF